jgi:hypothetical protein
MSQNVVTDTDHARSLEAALQMALDFGAFADTGIEPGAFRRKYGFTDDRGAVAMIRAALGEAQ